MKYIDRLLQGAPVEWTTLEDTRFVELANRARRPVKASERIPGSIPYYGANNIQDYVDGYTHSGTYILLAEDGSASIDNYSIQWATGLFWANNHVHVLKVQGQLNSRFLYHYLKTVNYAPFLLGGERAKLTQKNLLRIPIPIPPVAVQEEVVRVLDKFTALEAELEVALSTELDCRKRQYQYYRDALLTFDLSSSDGLCHSPLFPAPFTVEWHPLGEVGEFTRGGGLQKKDFTTEGVGCIHYGQIYTHYGTFAFETKTFVSEEFAQKARKAQCGDLVIATTSENDEDLCKAVAWLGKEEVVVSSDACFYTHKMAPKYVSYFFQSTHFQKQKRTFITGTKVRRVNAKDLAKIEISIPPLEVQERIVEILDKFDTLVNSISEGLPREIELRRKQYEYYRDALLSFEPQTSNF